MSPVHPHALQANAPVPVVREAVAVRRQEHRTTPPATESETSEADIVGASSKAYQVQQTSVRSGLVSFL
jgi:hypothetical protein